MANGEDTIRLIVDAGQSAPELERTAIALEKVAEATVKVADSGGKAARSVDLLDQATRRLGDDGGGGGGRGKQALDDIGDAAERTEKKGLNAGRSMLEMGRVVQDFTQGGLPGILNNIEGLTSALGGPAGLAGVMTAVGVAAYLGGGKIKEFWESLTLPAKEKIPATTDSVEGLTKAIKENKDAIEALVKQGSLYAFQLDELKDRQDRLAEQERKLRDAREARAIGPFAGKAAVARAGAFREAVAEYGGGEALMTALMNAGWTRERAEEVVAAGQRGERGMPEGIQRALARFGPKAQLQYFSPEARERARRQTEQTDAILKRNAERAKEQQKMADEDERVRARDQGERDREQAQAAARAARQQEHHMQQARRMEAEMGGPGFRAIGGPGRVRAMQRQVEAETGIRPGMFDTARAMMKAKQGEGDEMRNFVGSVVRYLSGTGQDVATLRQGRQMIDGMSRQRNQAALNNGH